jgi:hypothetical protein
MDRQALEYFKDRRIKLFLKDRIVYSGFIEQIFEDSMIFVDKFGTKVAIPYDIIERIEEAKDDNSP